MAGAPGVEATARPEIHAVVLAAGLSSRMAPRNKLLIAGADGRPMVAHVARAACACAARRVTVVLGYQAAAVEAALRAHAPHPKLRFVMAPDFRAGLSASLGAGLANLPASAAAALICLGDMKLVTAAMMDRILGAYDPATGRLIIVPTHAGQRGNPVLWDRRFFPAMCALTGDAGARALLSRHAVDVADIAMASAAVLRDFDTPDSL